ncbi:MAG: T9SS type A sorting domain-containing protein [Bacteroidales bacterium]|nr:T9SS type A sorting domain-containing protein [Bacteroidales bacterium]
MKKQMKLLLLFFFLLIAGSLQAQPLSGSLTIGSGSAEYPTLNAFIDSLVNNGISGTVTANIEPGTYNEQIIIPDIQGTSAMDTIVFQSATGDTADVKIVFTPTGSSDNFIIRFDGVSYITLKNLSFMVNGPSDYGTAIELVNGNKNINLEGNHFRGKNGAISALFDKYLIRTDNNMDSLLIIKDNTFEETNGSFKIWSFYKVDICDNKSANSDMSNQSFDISGGYGLTLSANYFKHGQYSITDIWGGCDNLIERNRIGGILYLYSWNENNGYSNLICNNFFNSLVYISASKNIKMCFNSTFANYHVLQIQNSDDLVISNNIFIGSDVNYQPLLFDSDTGIQYMDYNIIYSKSGILLNVAEVDYTSLNDWRTFSGLSEHDTNLYIVFADSLNNDLHVAPGQPDLFGVFDTQVLSDYDGGKRYFNQPNIGADEYSKHPLAGKYTVGPEPTDSFSSIDDAVYELNEYGISDTTIIIIKAGSYYTQITLDSIEGTGTSPITFASISNDPEDVEIYYATANYDSSWLVNLKGSDNIVFSGITFNSECIVPTVFNIQSESKNITITNCHLMNNSINSSGGTSSIIYSPFGSVGCDNMVITDNEFINGSYGICFESNAANRTKGIRIENNTFTGQYESAIFLYAHDSVQINYNTIEMRSNITAPYGIYLYDVERPLVNGNYVLIATSSGQGGYGIMLRECQNSPGDSGIIANNAVSMRTNDEKVCMGIINRDSDGNKFYHNSVHITGNNTISQSFRIWGTSSEIVVKNNIFSNNAKGTVYSVSGSDLESNYNNFYSNDTIFLSLGSLYKSLEDWCSGTQLDTNSLNVDPMFISDTNLHIYHANQFLDSAGIPVFSGTGNEDIDRQLRNATHPDIGADEYNFMHDGKDIISFSLAQQVSSAIINPEDGTVDIEIQSGVDLSSLIPEFSLSPAAIIKLEDSIINSGITAIDFTSPVEFTVIAEDSTSRVWTVEVNQKLSGKEILTFSLDEQVSPSVINAASASISIIVSIGTRIDSLVPVFTLSERAGMKLGNDTIISEVTAVDFTNEVVFKVQAEDGSTKEWKVNVEIQPDHINENSVDGFIVYPNPFSNKIFIQNMNIDEAFTYIVCDITGKIILNGKLDIHHQLNTIEINGAGIYLLHIYNNKSNFTIKLISE